MWRCRGAITKVAPGDYPTTVQLAGGAYAASATLAAPPAGANDTFYGVYPQQIPAIATGADNATTAVVPQTTLGATNSTVPASSSSPLAGVAPQPPSTGMCLPLTYNMCGF